MATRASGRPIRARNASTAFNWLAELDRRIRELPLGSEWLEDSELALQRCRRFIMARFPELPRPFSDSVVDGEISRREKPLRDSNHADRILRDLNAGQRSQLAGLLLDVIEALETYTRHGRTSKTVNGLAAEADRRLRVLTGKTLKICGQLHGLIKYAKRLHPVLRAGYVGSAERCLKILDKLKEDPPLALLGHYSFAYSDLAAIGWGCQGRCI